VKEFDFQARRTPPAELIASMAMYVSQIRPQASLSNQISRSSILFPDNR
jgi:hypothetical protein